MISGCWSRKVVIAQLIHDLVLQINSRWSSFFWTYRKQRAGAAFARNSLYFDLQDWDSYSWSWFQSTSFQLLSLNALILSATWFSFFSYCYSCSSLLLACMMLSFHVRGVLQPALVISFIWVLPLLFCWLILACMSWFLQSWWLGLMTNPSFNMFIIGWWVASLFQLYSYVILIYYSSWVHMPRLKF